MARGKFALRTILLCLLFIAAYYGAARFSVALARVPESNWTAVWFASGVGLLCVRALGVAGLVSVALASLGTSLIYYGLRAGHPLPLATAAALSTALLDVLQVWLADRAARRWEIREPGAGVPYGGLLGYLANVCVLPPLVTCTLLVFKDPLLGIGRASADGTAAGILTTLFVVVTGNALGLFLLGPLTVAWRRSTTFAGRWRELAVMLALVPLPILASTVAIPHVAILALAVALLAALRFGLPGSVLAMLVLTLSAVVTVMAREGPFPVDRPDLAVFGFALVVVVLGVAFHVVGGAVDELAHQRAMLERLVATRTRALEVKSAELAAAADRKAVFLAWLSHEARTPMNAVLGMIRLLRRDGPAGDWDRRLGIAEDAGRHLVQVLDNVLELSRLEADPADLRPEPADLARLAGDVAALLEPEAAARGLRLSLETGPGTDAGHCVDPLRVRQVLFNLVGNALKFTPAGQVCLRLRAEAEDGGANRAPTDRVVVEVEDTGPGVPPAQREAIFQAYARAGRGGPPGAGLGLAIVRQIVEGMGGRVSVAAGRLGGALFRVEFPAERAALAPAAAGPGEAPPPTPALDILLVEDAEENRIVVDGYLAPGGHRIVHAASGEEALHVMAGRRFDLVLMDIRLDGIDGVEATRRIRAMADPDAAQTPVVALTANASPGDRDAYAAAGMDEVLTKPVNPAALAAVVARYAPSNGAGVAFAGPTAAMNALFAEVAAALELELASLGDGDRERMAAIAHRLRGSAATYGHAALAAAAAALEEAAPAADPAAVAGATAALRRELARVASKTGAA
ncbi:ATP-binding protein [Azospirillum sp.]|uniref:ATP-binding protein n=1 Tax=Azospirillum sp. TaxID=34012 RepID=UPI002D3D3D51|nr:ATP-binding protein [Azospirillum sp.]HYD66860.1 ATP-binding protein [Azospirillum sp.]